MLLVENGYIFPDTQLHLFCNGILFGMPGFILFLIGNEALEYLWKNFIPTMKIQYCSDLHLEFPENNRYVNKYPILPSGEILLLAGDILPFALNHLDYSFFDYVADHFEAVYWVPGNHEYYGSDISKTADSVLEKIRSNVFLVNNHTVIHRDVNIICSSLWSHISPESESLLQKRLSDFSAITFNSEAFLPVHFNGLHEKASIFLKKEISQLKSASKNIVVSHHVPTLMNYPPKYKRSELSQGFAAELSDLIIDSNISNWIYGHHHFNTPDFVLGKTLMRTNQLGYTRQHEHASYKRNALFEL